MRLKILRFDKLVEFPVFPSPPAKPGERVLTPQQIEAAEREYRRTMTTENRIVRDDTISPFYFGLILAGYEIGHEPHGTSEKLSYCHQCHAQPQY